MRINRYIARSGVTSRRKADELVNSGRVFVNGKKITELGQDIDPENDIVMVDGSVLELPEHKYYLLNKPTGYITTKEDPHAKKTIFDLLPDDPSLFAVGRLDKDSTGLLLVTNDGDFAQSLIHPTKKVEKEYLVMAKKEITDSDIQRMEAGIKLADGKTQPAKVKRISNNKIDIIITEGKNRQIRRMLTALQNEVKELTRIRVAGIKLDIKEGRYRTLKKEEIKKYV